MSRSDDVATDDRRTAFPISSLFDVPPSQIVDDSNRTHILEDTLASFGVGAKVVHIERGPSITRYELKPERGVKISRIASLADDLALALAATSVRIEAPIPGKVRGRHRGAESNGLGRRDSRDPRRAAQSRASAAALDGARQRHHRPARSSAISARCRTFSSPARRAPASRSASTRSSHRCSSARRRIRCRC